ncbi:MAG: transposase [Bacillota bacterium]|nr:transposase [Bacillota bacterium]
MNSLGNFRSRLVKHFIETGEDLLQPEIERLSLIMADKLKIDGKKIRMDSFMVSSSCKNLSRIELTYKVNYNFIKILNKLYPDELTITLKEYLKNGHKNDTVYRTRDIDSESKLTFLLKQSAELFNVALDINSEELITSEEFILLERLLNDQIINNDSDNDSDNDNYNNENKVKIDEQEVEPKEGKDIKSTSLQNPSDPDATYRTKYGPNIGHVANITEVFDDDNRIYISYNYKPNIYSDTNFLRDFIEKQNKSEWEIMLLVDGAYYSYQLSKEAKEKNITLIPGELAGRKNNDKLPLTEHKIDSSTNEISECANGKKPEISTYDEEKEAYVAKFNKSDCENCEYASTCTIKEQKKYNKLRFTKKQHERSDLRIQMETKEYGKLSNQRAGIEGAPSIFRRKYDVDNMHVRGLVRSKIEFGFKVLAANFKNFHKGIKRMEFFALNYFFTIIMKKHFRIMNFSKISCF